MLGGWQKEKDTRLTDMIKKRVWRKEYDGVQKKQQQQQKERDKKKEGVRGREEREKWEETEL